MNSLAPPGPPAAPSATVVGFRLPRTVLAAIAARAAALDAEDGLLPVGDVADLARCGLLAAPLPVAAGGRGWGSEPDGAEDAFEALRAVGRASLPLGRLYEGHVNAVGLAMRLGTPAGRAAAAGAARSGRFFGVWATDDPAAPLRLEDGVLRGGKVLCSGAGLVERAAVTARTADGPQLVLVHLPRGPDRTDLSRWTPTGMRASATGAVDLDGIPVAPDMLLGPPDAYFGQPDFSGGAWRFLAVHLGGLEAVAEGLRAHLIRTGRGGDPHQAARLGTALTAAETARLWVREAGRLAEGREAEPERIVAYVNLARGAVERAALDVIEIAQRSVGLAAFARPNPLERLIRDLSTYLRQPAPDHALVSGAAAGLGFAEPVGAMWPDPGSRPGTGS